MVARSKFHALGEATLPFKREPGRRASEVATTLQKSPPPTTERCTVWLTEEVLLTRVTDYYALGITQGGVDFVDVDVHTDVPVYIDPTAIRHQTGPWAEACVDALQAFFQALINAIKNADSSRQQDLIYPLVEPNETHLGQSKGASSGRSLGTRAKADELIHSLSKSKAVASGFLVDLEDAALMVDGIDKDIISDITTCVIRRQLITYTQKQCRLHGIDMEVQTSGPIWEVASSQWVNEEVELPRANNDKLLLVPKSIVRVKLTVDKGRYYRGYLRPYFEDEVLANPRAGLIKVLTDRRTGEVTGHEVIKGALDEELGTTKPAITENTQKYPQALADYRDSLTQEDHGPMPDELLAERIGAEVEDLRAIFGEMQAVAPGKGGATLYHRCVARLMTALFTTSLGNEDTETPIHNGMKRLDITYDNVARNGFFSWVSQHYPAAMVVVECKNYGHDVANPEFDQLAMRFSPDRGRVGILACRAFQDKAKALARAKAIANDSNGYVLVLDDQDFERLIDDFEAAGDDFDARNAHPLLRERFQELIS